MASWVRPHRVILSAIVVISVFLPGSQMLSEWESLSVFTIYGAQFNDLVLGISRHANIGGQGYLLLEFSRPLIEYLHLPYTLDFIRLPVRLLGAIGLIFFYIIGRRWFGAWPALVGTALLAVNPIYHQYQNELVIAGPSLFVFIIFLERIQYLTRFTQRWWSWLSLTAIWALLLTMYGPSRIFSTVVMCLWFGWALVRAKRGPFSLTLRKLLHRTLIVLFVTPAILVLANPSNIGKLGPYLLTGPQAESSLIGGSEGGLWDVLSLNARIILQSFFLGGGDYTSSFTEATLIQGRIATIPSVIVPLVSIGFLVAALGAWRARHQLANRYSSVLGIAFLTSVPMLTSRIGGLDSTPDSSLVNYRLVFFLVPAYMAIAVLMDHTIMKKRLWAIAAGIVATAIFIQGTISIIYGHSDFVRRAAETNPALTGTAGQLQWLDGYSMTGRFVSQGSHFQQHEQYDRWAAEVAEEVSKGSDGQVVIVPTAITCFPEAPLETHTLAELNGKNYHPVFLSLYLASRLGGIKTAYVNVPPKDLVPGYIMFESGIFPGPIGAGADGTYEYESVERAGAKLMEFGSGELSVVVTTTLMELELAKNLLSSSALDYEVWPEHTVCW